MTQSAGRPLATQLALAIAFPGVVLLILVATWPGQVDAQRRADDTAAYFSGEIDHLLSTMRDLLAAPPMNRNELDDPVVDGPFAGQMEGMALFDRRGERLTWWGSPAVSDDPAIPAPDRDGRVRKDGILTRLILTVGPDADGSTLVGTWVLDSNGTGRRFAPDLPRSLRRDTNLQVRWFDTSAESTIETTPWSREPDANDTATHGAGARLLTPGGNVLGYVWVVPTPAAYQRELRVRESLALAVALLIAGLYLVVIRAWRVGAVAIVWPLLVVVGGRLALALARSPFEMLPRDLGSASLWGVFSWGRLLASPADLLLTVMAIYLVVRIAVRGSATHPSAGLRLTALGSALFLTAGLGWLARSLAQDSRVWVLEDGPPLPADARGILIAALAVLILATCRLFLTAIGPDWLARVGSGRRSATVVLAILLSATVVIMVQSRRDELALERLRTEVAPQIVEQSARRAAALKSALESVREHFLNTGADSDPRSSRDTFLAYHFWMNSELATSGYQSSLEFFNVSGQRFSHFGFDLPLFDESQTEESLQAADSAIVVYDEYTDAVSRPRALLHGETTVWRDGERLGRVVGHVLDEPENLPFQPAARPYLQALGIGFMDAVGGAFRNGPQYVLYDTFGGLILSSVVEAPPWSQQLRESGLRREVISVTAGERDYQGYALEESGRLHLLLLPQRTIIERLAGIVRLVLAVLLLFLLSEFWPSDGFRWRNGELRRWFTGSVYRKLVATMLLASIVPLLGLAIVMQAVLERSAKRELRKSATRNVAAAQRILEDYLTPTEIGDDFEIAALNDEILHWLRSVVGQEIHLFENADLAATSKRELFDSGLLTTILRREIHDALIDGGRSSILRQQPLGSLTVPVAYAPIRTTDPHRELIVAVPMIYEEQEIRSSMRRVRDLILLATVALLALVTIVASRLARSVSRPVRDLVETTHRLAAGEYETHVQAHTEDELAELVRSFNVMAASLSRQRADLERRRDYVETLLRYATTGVISTNSQGDIVTLNPAAGRLLNVDLHTVEESPTTLQHLLTAPKLGPLAEGLARHEHDDGVPFEVDLQLGETVRRLRCVRVSLPGDHSGPVGALLLLDDVTDLMRSNQLEAWAEMARAIAHEIKNPLTPIQLSADHLARLLADSGVLPSPSVEACLVTIGKQVKNLYEIAGEFSTYARLPDLTLQRMAADEFLREALSPYRSAPPPGIELEERYETSALIRIDVRVLARALVNLIENAFVAMPDGGCLAIRSREENGQVLIEVEDNGSGLSDEVRRRLFEPYFSTKSSGTGLGLAIVKRTVEAHQGTIDVSSGPARGTQFCIRLPIAPD